MTDERFNYASHNKLTCSTLSLTNYEDSRTSSDGQLRKELLAIVESLDVYCFDTHCFVEPGCVSKALSQRHSKTSEAVVWLGGSTDCSQD